MTWQRSLSTLVAIAFIVVELPSDAESHSKNLARNAARGGLRRPRSAPRVYTAHDRLVRYWSAKGTGHTVAQQLADLQRGAELMALHGFNHGDSGNALRIVDRPKNANPEATWVPFVDKQGHSYRVTPRLQGKFFATTNSGAQLIDAIHNPGEVFSMYEIHPNGESFRHVAGINRPTSEMVSHLYGLGSIERDASGHGHLLSHNMVMAVPGIRRDFHDYIMATALESGPYIPGGYGVVEQVVPGNKAFGERIAQEAPARNLGKAAILAWWGHGVHTMGDSMTDVATRLLEVKQQFDTAKELLLGQIGEMATVNPEAYAGTLDQFSVPMPHELRTKILAICAAGKIRLREDLLTH